MIHHNEFHAVDVFTFTDELILLSETLENIIKYIEDNPLQNFENYKIIYKGYYNVLLKNKKGWKTIFYPENYNQAKEFCEYHKKFYPDIRIRIREINAQSEKDSV